MDVSLLKYYIKAKYSLVFFCFLLVFACKDRLKISNINLNYKDDKAIDVSFVSNNHKNVSIHLKDNLTPVIGSFSSEGNRQTFVPIVPFSNGETYTVRYEGDVLSRFTIKTTNNSESPELLAIYPTTNVVPQNLLKMYFQFSKPMQEVGNVLDFIKVINKTTNKKADVFLELETELWNNDHTILTLWLDPGRIKKDLTPNKEKGSPILSGHDYEISIDENFRDAQGNRIEQTQYKTITVKQEDRSKPTVNNFDIQIPKNEASALIIQFNEPLDAILLTEVLTIYNNNGENIPGSFQLQNEETAIAFTPAKSWVVGKYKIQIQSKLEDLAGNNLNRLFDEDLMNKKSLEASSFKEMFFNVK